MSADSPGPSSSTLTAGLAASYSSDELVRVVVRLRPTQSGSPDVVRVAPGSKTILVQNRCLEELAATNGAATAAAANAWPFDAAIPPATDQGRLFKVVARPLLERCLGGINGALIAYGQTGSGKTYTMFGPTHDGRPALNSPQAGIIPRALRFIFDHLQLHGLPPCVVPPSQTGIEKAQEVTSSPSISHGVAGPHSMHASAADMGVPASWKVTLSALEIYQDHLTDLLPHNSVVVRNSWSHGGLPAGGGSSAPERQQNHRVSAGGAAPRLQIREDTQRGVHVEGLQEHVIHTAEQGIRLVAAATQARHVAATRLNHESSRSHCIIQITLELREQQHPGNNDATANFGAPGVSTKRSIMYLVDLEGSERIKATEVQGNHLKETASINRSLSALAHVITTLTAHPNHSDQLPHQPAQHVPYRANKLTHILSCALGGNALTTIIGTINPSASSRAETQSTLQFLAAAKAVRNRVVVNRVHEGAWSALQAELRSLRSEVAALRALPVPRAPAQGDVRASQQQRDAQLHREREVLLDQLARTSSHLACLAEQHASSRQVPIPSAAAPQQPHSSTSSASENPSWVAGRLVASDARVVELQQEMQALQSRAADLEAQLEAAEGRAAAAETRASQAEGRVAEAELSTADAEARAAAAEARVAVLQQQLADAASEAAAARAQVLAAEERACIAEHRATSAEAAAAAAASQVDYLQAQVAQLEAKLAAHQDVQQRTRSLFSALRKAVDVRQCVNLTTIQRSVDAEQTYDNPLAEGSHGDTAPDTRKASLLMDVGQDSDSEDGQLPDVAHKPGGSDQEPPAGSRGRSGSSTASFGQLRLTASHACVKATSQHQVQQGNPAVEPQGTHGVVLNQHGDCQTAAELQRHAVAAGVCSPDSPRLDAANRLNGQHGLHARMSIDQHGSPECAPMPAGIESEPSFRDTAIACSQSADHNPRMAAKASQSAGHATGQPGSNPIIPGALGCGACSPDPMSTNNTRGSAAQASSPQAQHHLQQVAPAISVADTHDQQGGNSVPGYHSTPSRALDPADYSYASTSTSGYSHLPTSSSIHRRAQYDSLASLGTGAFPLPMPSLGSSTDGSASGSGSASAEQRNTATGAQPKGSVEGGGHGSSSGQTPPECEQHVICQQDAAHGSRAAVSSTRTAAGGKEGCSKAVLSEHMQHSRQVLGAADCNPGESMASSAWSMGFSLELPGGFSVPAGAGAVQAHSREAHSQVPVRSSATPTATKDVTGASGASNSQHRRQAAGVAGTSTVPSRNGQRLQQVQQAALPMTEVLMPPAMHYLSGDGLPLDDSSVTTASGTASSASPDAGQPHLQGMRAAQHLLGQQCKGEPQQDQLLCTPAAHNKMLSGANVGTPVSGGGSNAPLERMGSGRGEECPAGGGQSTQHSTSRPQRRAFPVVPPLNMEKILIPDAHSGMSHGSATTPVAHGHAVPHGPYDTSPAAAIGQVPHTAHSQQGHPPIPSWVGALAGSHHNILPGTPDSPGFSLGFSFAAGPGVHDAPPAPDVSSEGSAFSLTASMAGTTAIRHSAAVRHSAVMRAGADAGHRSSVVRRSATGARAQLLLTPGKSVLGSNMSGNVTPAQAAGTPGRLSRVAPSLSSAAPEFGAASAAGTPSAAANNVTAEEASLDVQAAQASTSPWSTSLAASLRRSLSRSRSLQASCNPDVKLQQDQASEAVQNLSVHMSDGEREQGAHLADVLRHVNSHTDEHQQQATSRTESLGPSPARAATSAAARLSLHSLPLTRAAHSSTALAQCATGTTVKGPVPGTASNVLHKRTMSALPLAIAGGFTAESHNLRRQHSQLPSPTGYEQWQVAAPTAGKQAALLSLALNEHAEAATPSAYATRKLTATQGAGAERQERVPGSPTTPAASVVNSFRGSLAPIAHAAASHEQPAGAVGGDPEASEHLATDAAQTTGDMSRSLHPRDACASSASVLVTPAPATAVAGPTVLRRQVARLRGELEAQREESVVADSLLADELSRRLEAEAGLRSQLAARTQEASSLTMQVEQLLAANDALGAENVARSERIAHLEDVLARVCYSLNGLRRSAATMSLRASAAQGPGAGFSTETSGPQLLLPPSSLTLSQGTRLGDGVRAGVGFGGGDGKVGDPEVSGHSLINSLDLACPGVSGYTGQTAGGGADDTATSGSLKRHPGGDGHRYSSGMERRVSRLLDLVKSQLHNRKQYIRQVEGALQEAQAKIIDLEHLAQAEAPEKAEGGASSLQSALETQHVAQIEARDQVVAALKEQLAVSELERQEAVTAVQLLERQVMDMSLQQGQYAIEAQRAHAAAAAQHSADLERIRELERHHLEVLSRATELEAELSAQLLRISHLQTERASISAQLMLATAAVEATQQEVVDLRQELARLQHLLSQQQQQQQQKRQGPRKGGVFDSRDLQQGLPGGHRHRSYGVAASVQQTGGPSSKRGVQIQLPLHQLTAIGASQEVAGGGQLSRRQGTRRSTTTITPRSARDHMDTNRSCYNGAASARLRNSQQHAAGTQSYVLQEVGEIDDSSPLISARQRGTWAERFLHPLTASQTSSLSALESGATAVPLAEVGTRDEPGAARAPSGAGALRSSRAWRRSRACSSSLGRHFMVQYISRTRASAAAGTLLARASTSQQYNAQEAQAAVHPHAVQGEPDTQQAQLGGQGGGGQDTTDPGSTLNLTAAAQEGATPLSPAPIHQGISTPARTAGLKSVAYIVSPARRAPRPHMPGTSGLSRVSHVVLGTRRVFDEEAVGRPPVEADQDCFG